MVIQELLQLQGPVAPWPFTDDGPVGDVEGGELEPTTIWDEFKRRCADQGAERPVHTTVSRTGGRAGPC